MAKIRKKNNPIKRKRAMSQAFVSGLGIAQVDNDKCHVVDLVKGVKYKNASHTLVKHLTDTPFEWVVLLAVFCTESNGKKKMVTGLADSSVLDENGEIIHAHVRQYQRDMVDGLNKAHSILAHDCAKVMTVNHLGWIASPFSDIDFDLEAACNLLESMGAWK